MLYMNCSFKHFFNLPQQKVRDECRVNCSCDIAYIWEVNHVVHSKTVVNCSGKGFLDFPNPQDLPKPTDTLDLRNNKVKAQIQSAHPLTYYQKNSKKYYA